MEEKQLHGRFKRLINNISYKKTWTWLRKCNLKRETGSLLIATQDNAVRTNHIKSRIDKIQQNSKCTLCSDRDETINHIKSEYCKLAQKEYKARHDWVGKVIHWEMCKNTKTLGKICIIRKSCPFNWWISVCCFKRPSLTYITNITPHGSDDGSVEPKRYIVDFSINLSFHLDYLLINFSLYIVGLQSFIYFPTP